MSQWKVSCVRYIEGLIWGEGSDQDLSECEDVVTNPHVLLHRNASTHIESTVVPFVINDSIESGR